MNMNKIHHNVRLYIFDCMNMIYIELEKINLIIFFEKIGDLAYFMAGAIGGTIGATLTCPLEVAKTRLQASQLGNILFYYFSKRFMKLTFLKF